MLPCSVKLSENRLQARIDLWGMVSHVWSGSLKKCIIFGAVAWIHKSFQEEPTSSLYQVVLSKNKTDLSICSGLLLDPSVVFKSFPFSVLYNYVFFSISYFLLLYKDYSLIVVYSSQLFGYRKGLFVSVCDLYVLLPNWISLSQF